MKRLALDAFRAGCILLALWLIYALISFFTDTGEVADSFRSAMHNPYGNDTPGLLDRHFPSGTAIGLVLNRMQSSRFACHSSTFLGPLVVTCGRGGNGGKLFCDRRWIAEFLFERSITEDFRLTKHR